MNMKMITMTMNLKMNFIDVQSEPLDSDLAESEFIAIFY